MAQQPGHPTSRNTGFHRARWPWWLAILLLALAQPAWAATTVVVGTDPSKAVIKGTLVTPEQVLDGELVIEGDARRSDVSAPMHSSSSSKGSTPDSEPASFSWG